MKNNLIQSIMLYNSNQLLFIPDLSTIFKTQFRHLKGCLKANIFSL